MPYAFNNLLGYPLKNLFLDSLIIDIYQRFKYPKEPC